MGHESPVRTPKSGGKRAASSQGDPTKQTPPFLPTFSLLALYNRPSIMASSHAADDELHPEQTEGFKVAESKTIDEYHQLGRHTASPHSRFMPKRQY